MQDEKFVDSFIKQYSITHPDSGTFYYIYLSKTKNKLRHVNSKEVEIIRLNVRTLTKILRKHKNIEHIYFHNFPKNMFSICRHISREFKIYWIFYGIEIYQNVLYTKILDDYSESIYTSIFKKKSFLKILPTKFIKILLQTREKIRIYKLKRILRRIDYFCHWNKYDYDQIKEMFPTFDAQFILFGYNHSFSALELPTKVNDPAPSTISKIGKKLIMLGHGASVSLNHLTVLAYLKHFKNQSFQIVCPVSYGNMKYKEYLIDYAKVNNFENLTFIEKFVTFQDYVNIISNVDVFVMNNIRTQGGSNISLALKLGKKVYMNSQNPHYKYFIELGFVIFSTSDLLQSSLEEILTPLSPDQKESNQTLIQQLPVMTTSIYKNLP